MHNTSIGYKQMYNKTISWDDNWILIFICFMGILLLESSALSSSSFMIASFLIQTLRWIRSSSRVEIFIFVIDWGIFFGRWELDLQRRASSSSQILLKVITSFWNTFLKWMNSMILGGHSRWPSPILHSSLLLSPLEVVLWFMTAWSLHSGSSHSLAGFLRSYFDLCYSVQIAWSRNETSSMSLGKTLVEQVDLWLNHQWSSRLWPSSSCEMLLASSPFETGTSMLM